MPTVDVNGLATNVGASPFTEPVDLGPVSGKVSSAAAYGYPADVAIAGMPTTANPPGVYA